MDIAVKQSQDVLFSDSVEKLTREVEILNDRFEEEIMKFDIIIRRLFDQFEKSDKLLKQIKERKYIPQSL